jgi:hypothetical protein
MADLLLGAIVINSLLTGPHIVASFSENKEDYDRRRPFRYADIYTAISSNCKDFRRHVGMTKTSAYGRRANVGTTDLRHSFGTQAIPAFDIYEVQRVGAVGEPWLGPRRVSIGRIPRPACLQGIDPEATTGIEPV